MTLDFFCPACDHHVQVVTYGPEALVGPVEAWCATAHLRPVRMTTTDPHAD